MRQKLIVLFVALLATSFTHALVLSPMEAQISIAGKRKSTTFTVSQAGKDDVPVQVTLFERTIDENGKETRTPSKDFVFYPEQFVLKGGESRNVRLNYKGPTDIKVEKSYRLLVEQVPVELKPAKTNEKKVQVNFLLNFVASVYVQPKESEPFPKVVGVQMNSSGKQVEITFENAGTEHFLLRRITEITLEDAKGTKKTLKDAELKKLTSENLLAKGKRKLTFDAPEGFTAQKASIEWSKEPSS